MGGWGASDQSDSVLQHSQALAPGAKGAGAQVWGVGGGGVCGSVPPCVLLWQPDVCWDGATGQSKADGVLQHSQVSKVCRCARGGLLPGRLRARGRLAVGRAAESATNGWWELKSVYAGGVI